MPGKSIPSPDSASLGLCFGLQISPRKNPDLMNDNNYSNSSPLPLYLSAAALVGVLILFLLFLGQRSTARELRAMILNERANAALNANAGADAETLLAEVYELNPDTPAVWRRRAIARMMAGQTSEAIIAAKEHLTANPGDTGMSALLGAAQILSKDYDGADQTLTAGLQIVPNQRDLVQNLSELRRLQKRPADAAVLIDGFLAQNPTDGFFQFKRAMADVAGDLTAQRRKEINDAIDGGNATAGIYVVAAAIDFRDGKPDAARGKLEMANQRATAQDMRTMLEDEFFRDHIQFNQPGAQAPGAGAPAAAPAAPAQDANE
jgi:tetratricopeptide (TPR) repeat protein